MPDIDRNPLWTRFGTWNVGSMTGRSGKVAEALERRKVKVCCIQETRWKGEGTEKNTEN